MTLRTTIPRLPPTTFGAITRSFETIDSTNSTAKELAQEGALEGTVVTAEDQRAGKGRLGRSWESEKGKNLTFSIILRPHLTHILLGLLPLLAGTAVCETLREEYHVPSECKWPNDVLIGTKKISGILSEAVHQGDMSSAVIVGIGINVNQASFPVGLGDRATSLYLSSGREHDRTLLLTRLLGRMEALYEILQSGGADTIIARWTAVSPIIGKPLRVTDGSTLHEGTARGIAPDGGLLLETSAGIMTIRAGDVTLR